LEKKWLPLVHGGTRKGVIGKINESRLLGTGGVTTKEESHHTFTNPTIWPSEGGAD